MPSYPEIPPGFGLIRHKFTNTGGTFEGMVLHGVSLPGAELAFNVASELMANFATQFQLTMSNQWKYVECDAVINNAGVLSTGSDTSHGFTGSNSSQVMAPNTCVLIRKNTTAIGKHFRGRMFMPGVGSSGVNSDGANIGGSFFSTYQTEATAFLTAIQMGTTVNGMVLLHRLLSVPPTPVVGLTVEPKLATQRRRLRKVPHR